MKLFSQSMRQNFIAIFIAGLLILMIWWLWSATPETVFRIIRYNTSGIEDYQIFPSRSLQASKTPFYFSENPAKVFNYASITVGNDKDIPLDTLLQANDTTAFIIIKSDNILYENYYNGGVQSAPSLAFSMTKSMLSILIGCAIEDGYIQSVNQPVTDYVPELSLSGFDYVTIRHLLQMTSGMDYVENDNPFGVHPRFYYTTNLEKEILKLKAPNMSGQKFKYKSGENALLGLILTRALKTKTITTYMQERLWEPLGMEYNGQWSIDHEGDGLEKTWCCLSATARDFAKFGRLYLNGGDWNGAQIISKSWVEQSTRLDTEEGSAWNYQYQWWLPSKNSNAYMAIGHLGQYLYIHPEKQVIIVRLGKSEGTLSRENWLELLKFLSENSN